jgi:hypothetical protein
MASVLMHPIVTAPGCPLVSGPVLAAAVTVADRDVPHCAGRALDYVPVSMDGGDLVAVGRHGFPVRDLIDNARGKQAPVSMRDAATDGYSAHSTTRVPAGAGVDGSVTDSSSTCTRPRSQVLLDALDRALRPSPSRGLVRPGAGRTPHNR